MSWRIPLFDLNYGEEEEEAVRRIIKSKWISQGPETDRFEKEFEKYLGIKHVLATSSGTTALHLLYVSAGIKEGDEVIVPALTFIATITPILFTGAKPVFADIHSLRKPNISVETVESLITKKTKAIVFVYYAGFMDNVFELKELAERKGIFFLEDAAHAHGSEVNGVKAGTLGDGSAFSFFANKNLATGEGGAISTNSDIIYEKAKLLRSHGMTSIAWDRYRGAPEYDVIELGYNYRWTELQAALARVQLKKLKASNERRKKLVALYRELLEGSEVLIPFEDFAHSANYIFPILLPEERRDAVKRALNERGIQTSHHYTPPYLFTFFREKFGTNYGIAPNAEEFARRELTLPLYPGLKEEEVEEIVEVLKRALKGEV